MRHRRTCPCKYCKFGRRFIRRQKNLHLLREKIEELNEWTWPRAPLPDYDSQAA